MISHPNGLISKKAALIQKIALRRIDDNPFT